MSDFAILVSGSGVVLPVAVLGVVGLVRRRARKRWKAAVDAYAEREIVRDRRLALPRPVRTLRARPGVSKQTV